MLTINISSAGRANGYKMRLPTHKIIDNFQPGRDIRCLIFPRNIARDLIPLIDKLAWQIVQEVKDVGYDGAFAGLLNYTCTRLALKVVRQQFGAMRYWIIAILTGTFKNIADEFYRRIGVASDKSTD